MLAVWLADAPARMLPLFDEAARSALCKLSCNTGELAHRLGDVFVRITALPIQDAIHQLRRSHYGVLVRTDGVVTRCSGVFRQLLHVAYDCSACGAVVELQRADSARASSKPACCPQCASKGPFAIDEAKAQYRRFQKMALQERPGSVAAGRMPRCVDVVLMHGLMGCARPGEEVEVTGVYTPRFDRSLNAAAGLRQYELALVANYVRRCTEPDRGDIEL
jgi:DNA replication licensing factor MCM2